jgi:hypothetical protein
MRGPRASWLLVLALVAPAQADRQAEDWLGTWTGKATWTGCTVEGASTISLAITWRDYGIFVDGAGLYEGLGELAPEGRDDGGLALDLKDVSFELKRTKAKKGAAAKLELHTAAQCTLTANLTRAGSGIAACDDVIALASVAASCGVTVDDDPADEVEAWQALAGKKAKRAAKACGARATALRERLVAGSCLAPEHDPSRVPACLETWALGQKLFQCPRMSAERQRSTLATINDFRESLRALHDRDGADTIAAEKCAETTEILRDVADAYGCL